MREDMQFDPLQFIVNLIWSLPFWTKVLLSLLMVARVCWPGLFAERATSPRRWRRRRRRFWDD
jgi:hypothetical protein